MDSLTSIIQRMLLKGILFLCFILISTESFCQNEGKLNWFEAFHRADSLQLEAYACNGWDVNALDDKTGMPALCMATLKNDRRLCLYLIQLGANASVQDKNGFSSIDYAKRNNNAAILKILEDSKINLSDLLDLDMDELLLERIKHQPASLYSRGKDGQTLLHKIACLNKSNLLQSILALQPYLNIRDQNGNTPLMCAITLRHCESALLLIKKGANTLIGDKDGNTPQSMAKMKKMDCVVLTQNESNRTTSINRSKIQLIIPTGHTDGINSLCFSSDGKNIVSGSSDKTLKLWDLQTGLVLKTFKGHSGSVYAIAISKDGNFIISASQDQTIKIWDIVSGKEIRTIQTTYAVTALALSPDGKLIASCSSFGPDISLWDFDSGRLINTCKGHQNGVTSVVFSEDNRYLVSASYDKTIKIWDLAGSKEIKTFRGHSDKVANAKFSPNGKLILSSSFDETIKLWDVEKGSAIKTYKGEAYGCNNLTFTPDGTDFIAGSNMVSIKTGEIEKQFNGHFFSIKSAAFYIDLVNKKKYLATCSNDKTIQLWNFDTGKQIKILKGYTNPVLDLDVSSNGQYFATGQATNNPKSKTIYLWNLALSEKPRALSMEHRVIDKIKFSPDGNQLLTSSARYNPSSTDILKKSSYDMTLWDIKKAEVIKSFAGHKARINSFDFSADGRFILSCSSDSPENGNNDHLDNSIRIWDLDKGNEIKTYTGEEAEFGSVVFNKDSKTFLSSPLKFGLNAGLWDTDGKKRKSFKGGAPTIFSKDYKKIITKGFYNNLTVWDAKTLEELYSDKEKSGRVISLDISNDDQMIASGTMDGEVCLWTSDSLRLIKKMGLHNDYVKSVHFLKDSDKNRKYLLSCSNDNTIKITDCQSNKELLTYLPIAPEDWMIINSDNYYMSSKGSLSKVGFTKNGQVYKFEQFDLLYNRPDLVLKSFPHADSLQIKTYYAAYRKRLQKMKFKEEMFKPDFKVPEIEISNKDSIPTEIDNEEIFLRIKASDSERNLNRINIWVNDIPIFGINGIDLSEKKVKTFSSTVSIKLSQGNNTIQVSCLNQDGVESFRESLEVIHTAGKAVKPDLYVTVIGVSKYKDNSKNLKYAVVDGRCIVELFKKQGSTYEHIYIDSLFDEKVSTSSVMQLKRKLQNTKVDDKVILFISGHGLLSDSLDYYLATHHVDFGKPEINGLAYDSLESILDGIPARNKLLLMDACHSGEVDREEVTRIENLKSTENITVGRIEFTSRKKGSDKNQIGYQNTFELMKELFADLRKSSGATVIASAGGAQYSYEMDKLKNGVFTHCLLIGLGAYGGKKEADLNGDGKVMLSELQKYLETEVPKLTNGGQKPTSRAENLVNDWSF